MTEVCLTGLTKRYGELLAVDHLALTVQSGELVALLGPSGCGKTTTMRMIAGLLAPTHGDIHFDGRSVLNVPAERRGAVMVFQKHLLFPHMSVAENVGFGLKMRRVDKRVLQQRVSKMLEIVQLPGFERRRAHELSGGQQQRVALARALVIEPQVLLLDEPLANLDANLRLEMRKLIRTLQQELGITTIFVTHDQEEAVMLADRVALMVGGVLQQFDTPRAFYEAPCSTVVARFFRNENFLPGVKQGALVETACGPLVTTAAATLPDGPVLVTIRPEHITVAGANDGNRVTATVINVLYLGTYVQLQVVLGEWQWTVNLPPNVTLQPDDVIRLTLPQEHLWLLPADPTG
ncbi:MAG: ABC transporter ATP-binding protein [Caldilineaceae bacterium]